MHVLNPLQNLLDGLAVVADRRGHRRRSACVLGGCRARPSTADLPGACIIGLGLWHDAMATLTATLVATVAGDGPRRRRSASGWAAAPRSTGSIRPVLDAGQTMPAVRLPACRSWRCSAPAGSPRSSRRSSTPRRSRSRSSPTASAGCPPTTVEAADVGRVDTLADHHQGAAADGAQRASLLATNQGLIYVLSMVVVGGLVGARRARLRRGRRASPRASCSARGWPPASPSCCSASCSTGSPRRPARPRRRAAADQDAPRTQLRPAGSGDQAGTT